jgi:hypothetical protein
VRAVAAAALDVHGDHYIRPQRADEADVIADDVAPAPLGDHLVRRERIAEIDGASEVLLRAIDPMG